MEGGRDGESEGRKGSNLINLSKISSYVFYATFPTRRSSDLEDPLEREMATLPSILAWRIP